MKDENQLTFAKGLSNQHQRTGQKFVKLKMKFKENVESFYGKLNCKISKLQNKKQKNI